MKIWTIDDELIDKLVDSYIDYVTNPYNEWRQTSSSQIRSIAKPDIKPEFRALKYDRSFRSRMTYDDDSTPATVINLPKPQVLHTRAQIITIIHQLYLRSFTSESGKIILNSSIMQKISKHYNYILEVLCHQRIIHYDKESLGKFARIIYYFNPEIKVKYVPCRNKLVLNRLGIVSKEFTKIQDKEIQKAKKITSSTFIENYNKAIKQFRIKDIDSAYNYIEDQKNQELAKLYISYDSKTINIYDYYKNMIFKIGNKEYKKIDSADNNGRIYHIITQLPKALRQFTNIKYIIDTRNSHPILFNIFIYEYYFNNKNININNTTSNINYKLYIIISLFINNNYNRYSYHYFKKNLYNVLIDNGYGADTIAYVKSIKRDIWHYLFITSKGKLWDEINEDYSQFTRTQIKKKMFSSLFYSYAKNIKVEKIYAKAFQEKFPTVTKIIRFYKKTYSNQCNEQNFYVYKDKVKRDGVMLAHKLMQLESAIFQQILTKLFKMKDLICVGIHDAIAIFDESSVTPDIVKEVMEKVYLEFGLSPTFSIETPDADYAKMYKDDEEEYNLDL